MDRNFDPREKEKAFERKIISEYLKYGSVDKVFEKNSYNLPISYPGFQRLVDKWDIVKAAGPNSKLSEAITFLVLLSNHKISLEKLYKKMPPSFKTSMSTLHRILHNIKEGIIRRFGTALVIAPDDNPELVLVGDDISTPRLELGKPFGSLSLPMTYCKENEESKISILRVLQQEVFTKQTIEREFPYEIIPNNPKPFMYLDIADVRVLVYSIRLPEYLSRRANFNSYKVINHRFLHLSKIIKASSKYNFRSGIKEIGLGYQKYIQKRKLNYVFQPILEKALINTRFASLAFDFVE